MCEFYFTLCRFYSKININYYLINITDAFIITVVILFVRRHWSRWRRIGNCVRDCTRVCKQRVFFSARPGRLLRVRPRFSRLSFRPGPPNGPRFANTSRRYQSKCSRYIGVLLGYYIATGIRRVSVRSSVLSIFWKRAREFVMGKVDERSIYISED